MCRRRRRNAAASERRRRAHAHTQKKLQKVQQGLSDSEKQDKSDESPVTVADYGA